MKKQSIAKRILTGLLALGMTVSATLSASADTITIDQNGFTNPSITKGTVYYWHKGAPPATLDGTSYPVIMVWDDKYYLGTDNTFYSEIVGTNKTNHAEDLVSPKIRDIDSPMDVGWELETNSVPSGVYHKNRLYSSRSVSELPFDYSVLKNTGTAVSFGAAGLPRFVAVEDQSTLTINGETQHLTYGNQLYNNKLNVMLNGDTQASYAIWFPNPTTGNTMENQKYWLTSTHRIYSYYDEVDRTFGTKAKYVNSLDWFLDVKRATQSNFTSKSYTYTPEHNGLNSRGYEARPPKVDLGHRTWIVSQIEGTQKYHIFGIPGGDAHLQSFYASDGRDKLITYVKNIDKAGGIVGLLHTGSQLLTAGNGGGPVVYSWQRGKSTLELLWTIITEDYSPWKKDDRYEDRKPFEDAQADFDLYWGEPATISFCQVDFTVQKGQVQTFDGPIAVGHDVIITVEDGGVLSCSDWILNNGTIVVKPGGTLLLQTYETANEQTRYGTIASLHEAAGDDGGRIYCDGTIIVMPDCKLCCSGKYGLTLGEGAQVVNYGAIISENLSAAQSYTIENRGDNSYVFAGWGLKDCGSSLLTERITSTSFTEKGAREKSATVNLPSNAIYGKGSTRFNANTASTVTHKHETLSGYVTDNVTDLPPLPNDASGGKKAQYFTIADGFPYTVYYPDTGEVIYSERDRDVTFAIYEDPEKESYLYYETQNSYGDWRGEKYTLDPNRYAEVYKSYFNPEHSTHPQKLVFKGSLKNWDGTDQNYFAPPETDEVPLVDVILSEKHGIYYDSAPKTWSNMVQIPSKSRVLIYEEAESCFLGYSGEVYDYNSKTVLKVDERVSIYHLWYDQNYMLHQDLLYEGILKEWDPTLIED